MTDTSYILFPHTQISSTVLEKIITRFGNPTICRPWFMEWSAEESEGIDISSVHIQNPDADTKPKENFDKLLAEYRLWVKQNQDKGHRQFLTATQKGTLTEDTPWEIRQLISKGGEAPSDQSENQAFKWNLMLHLAREFDESRTEAEEMLNKLMNHRSPLEGALEIDPPQHFFENTSLMETQLQVDEHHLGQIFEAWFGLFGKFISKDASLITLDRNVMNYAAELFEPEEKIIRPSAELAEDREPENIRHLPKIQDGKSTSKDPVLTGLSGKTLILMED